jgi:uncharacterized protein involved in exopolysaccharide biosynthesis
MLPQSIPRRVVDDDPLELHIGDHFVTLVRSWRLIAVVTAVFALCTAGALAMMDPEYRAAARLVVFPSAAGERSLGQVEQVYQTLAVSNDLAVRAVEALGLQAGSHPVSPQELVLYHLNVSGSKESGVITIEAAMWSGDLAARVANEMARQLVAGAKEMNTRQLAAAASTLQGQVETARAKLENIEQRLTKTNQDAGLDLLQTDVASRLSLRKELPGLTATIESEKARLQRAQEQLASQERVRANPRAIDGGAALEGADGEPRVPLRSDALNPYINPVYETLNQQVANTTASLAALEKRRSELVNGLGVGGETDARVRTMYAKKAEIEALQRDYDVAKAAYVSASAKYQEVALRLAGQADDIRLLDPATVPLRRSAPRVVRNTAIWSGIGFVLACAFVLGRRTLSDSTKR